MAHDGHHGGGGESSCGSIVYAVTSLAWRSDSDAEVKGDCKSQKYSNLLLGTADTRKDDIQHKT